MSLLPYHTCRYFCGYNFIYTFQRIKPGHYAFRVNRTACAEPPVSPRPLPAPPVPASPLSPRPASPTPALPPPCHSPVRVCVCLCLPRVPLLRALVPGLELNSPVHTARAPGRDNNTTTALPEGQTLALKLACCHGCRAPRLASPRRLDSTRLDLGRSRLDRPGSDVTTWFWPCPVGREKCVVVLLLAAGGWRMDGLVVRSVTRVWPSRAVCRGGRSVSGDTVHSPRNSASTGMSTVHCPSPIFHGPSSTVHRPPSTVRRPHVIIHLSTFHLPLPTGQPSNVHRPPSIVNRPPSPPVHRPSPIIKNPSAVPWRYFQSHLVSLRSARSCPVPLPPSLVPSRSCQLLCWFCGCCVRVVKLC